jgi:hypothetical protein
MARAAGCGRPDFGQRAIAATWPDMTKSFIGDVAVTVAYLNWGPRQVLGW